MDTYIPFVNSSVLIVLFLFFVIFLFIRSNKKSDIEKNLISTECGQQYVFPTDNLKRYKFPTHINDLVIDRAYSNISEVFIVVIEPEKAPPFHKHDDAEQVFFILEGTGILTIGKKQEKFNVSPGDIVRIPVSTYHSIRADKRREMKYLCVDCFSEKPSIEQTWDDHVKVLCKNNGWDYAKVVSSQM